MTDPFHGRGRWLIAIAAVSLALTLAFGLFFDDPSGIITAEANAFSRSAIGYHALVRFLNRSGLPVQVSRYQTENKVAPGAALLILSPGSGDLDRAAELMGKAQAEGIPTIVVLPKWKMVKAEDFKPRWAEQLELLKKEEVEQILATLLGLGEEEGPSIQRRPAAIEATFGGGRPSGELGHLVPELPWPQTLQASQEFVSLLHDDDGATLVAQLGGETDLWILSDPDLVNNAGLGLGQNAAILHHLLVNVIGAHAVVIDETHHGFLQPPSIWRELTTFPLALVTLHLAILLGAVVWTASQRYGRPQPAPPRVAPGIGTLIDNTARLVRLAGDPGDTLKRYFQLTVRHAARQCALPPNLELAEQVRRLAQLGKSRGVSRDLDQLTQLVRDFRKTPKAQPSTLEICRDLAAWRKEITDGFR